MEKNKTTIAAISTALSPSGIAVIRISGPEAFRIADLVYHGKKEKRLSDQKANTIHYGLIRDYDSGETIDEVLVMLFRSPHSYTGEDTVEIDCHGGIVAAGSILRSVIHAGARPAEPGEFSKRAFLNGRMDLSQAEAVMDIIGAKNKYALESSVRQLRGSVSGRTEEIRSALIHEMARIESALDDPEHYDLTGYSDELKEIVRKEQKEIRDLLKKSESGKMIQEGIRTVILGKPNAGKSSLWNVLAGEEKAIVTEIAGTTRDVLEDQITIGGISLNIMDTAGIRNTENRIEQIGVERAKKQAEEADLILYVVDSSVPLDKDDDRILNLIRDKKAIILLNKSDLKTVVTKEMLSEKGTDRPVIPVSAKTEEGMEQLAACIRELFFGGEISVNDEIYITNIRQKTALEDADKSLDLVLKSIDDGMPEDFYSIDLAEACDALGRITGQTVGEDLVNEIFSRFCMGK